VKERIKILFQDDVFFFSRRSVRKRRKIDFFVDRSDLIDYYRDLKYVVFDTIV